MRSIPFKKFQNYLHPKCNEIWRKNSNGLYRSVDESIQVHIIIMNPIYEPVTKWIELQPDQLRKMKTDFLQILEVKVNPKSSSTK